MMRENEKRFETTDQSASVGIGIIIITIAVDETLPVILWRSLSYTPAKQGKLAPCAWPP